MAELTCAHLVNSAVWLPDSAGADALSCSSHHPDLVALCLQSTTAKPASSKVLVAAHWIANIVICFPHSF